jgi:hypothetical protein
MKKVIKIFLTMLLSSIMVMPALQAQNARSNNKKMTRQEKKEMRLKAEKQSRGHYFQLLQQRLFVMQADQLYGRGGLAIPVTPSLNFLAIKGNKVIFQFGLDGAFSGPNGLGGITAEGFVDNYSLNPGKNEKKAMVVTGSIRPKGSGNWISFRLSVGSEGNAYLVMNLPFGGILSMNGRIVDYAHTSVFKGFTQF